jgi:hypothetical protein
MAPLEKAKQLLRDKGYSEIQINEMQSSLYALAKILVDEYLKVKGQDNGNGQTNQG